MVPVPIEILTRPAEAQSVEKGDVVNLTVVATSDSLYPLTYKWTYKNKTYEVDQAPPLVLYDTVTRLAYINTTDLSDQQMRDIKGVYRREIYHEFESMFVDVEVSLKDEPVRKLERGAGRGGELAGLRN